MHNFSVYLLSQSTVVLCIMNSTKVQNPRRCIIETWTRYAHAQKINIGLGHAT